MSEEPIKKYYLEDHVQGQRIDCGACIVTAHEIIDFASKWDPQPWHIDESAAKASFFGGLTACSAHIFAMYCSISPRWQNGGEQQAIASLGFDEMRMLKPVYAGDRLRCVTVFETVRPSRSKPDRGIIVYASTLYNQDDAAVFSIKCTTLTARRPAGAA